MKKNVAFIVALMLIVCSMGVYYGYRSVTTSVISFRGDNTNNGYFGDIAKVEGKEGRVIELGELYATRSDPEMSRWDGIDSVVPYKKDLLIVVDNTLLRVNLNGKVIWDLKAESFLGGLYLVNNTVFACTKDRVYAVNANNGSIRWTFNPRTHQTDSFYFFMKPDGEKVYVLTIGEEKEEWVLYALDAKTGEKLWHSKSSQYGGYGLHFASLGITGDTVWIAFSNGLIEAFDSKTGKRLFRENTINDIAYTELAVDDICYIVIANGTIEAYDAKTPKLLWSYTFGEGRDSINLFNSLIMGNSLVVIESDGTITLLNRRTSEKFATINTEQPNLFSPPVAMSKDKLAYLGENRKQVIIVDLKKKKTEVVELFAEVAREGFLMNLYGSLWCVDGYTLYEIK